MPLQCRKSMSAWLAQSVEHETLNLRVVGSSPTLGDFFSFLLLRLRSDTYLTIFYGLQFSFW